MARRMHACQGSCGGLSPGVRNGRCIASLLLWIQTSCLVLHDLAAALFPVRLAQQLGLHHGVSWISRKSMILFGSDSDPSPPHCPTPLSIPGLGRAVLVSLMCLLVPLFRSHKKHSGVRQSTSAAALAAQLPGRLDMMPDPVAGHPSTSPSLHCLQGATFTSSHKPPAMRAQASAQPLSPPSPPL